MEQRQAPHTWRTREDPLEAVWPQALAMSGQAPEMEAKAHFEHPAQEPARLAKGGVVATLPAPGAGLAVDWTEMGGLGITIQGKTLVHRGVSADLRELRHRDAHDQCEAAAGKRFLRDAHGHLKRRIGQHLLVRGSRDFSK